MQGIKDHEILDDIRQILREADEYVTTAMIARQLRKSSRAVSAALSKLVKRGDAHIAEQVEGQHGPKNFYAYGAKGTAPLRQKASVFSRPTTMAEWWAATGYKGR